MRRTIWHKDDNGRPYCRLVHVQGCEIVALTVLTVPHELKMPEHLKVNPFHATAGAARYGVSLPRKHPNEDDLSILSLGARRHPHLTSNRGYKAFRGRLR